MYLYQKTALLCALIVGLSSFTACTDKKSDSESDSKADTDQTESTSDKKVDLYVDSEGNAYYLDDDGTKMMVYSYAASDDDDSEYDETEYYVYDHYEEDGLIFDIPSGWFADTSYGAPMLFMEAEDGDIDYDESISLVPTSTVLDSDVTEVDKDTIEQYFEDLVSYGYYDSFEITDSGELSIAGKDANYFDITVSYSLDEDEMSFRSRYIFTNGDGSYCVSITSADTDDSFEKMLEVYDEVEGTLTLPDAEQVEETDEELEEEAELDDSDNAEDTDSSEE